MEFLVGGTYGNRRGLYEVLARDGDKLEVRYDDGTTATLSAQAQNRIAENLALEARTLAPSDDDHINRQFFRLVGFLARHTEMVECFAPPQSTRGFAETYQRLTGMRADGAPGYYLHEREADKWGIQLRVTFSRPEVDLNLEFAAAGVIPVADPGSDSTLRVNSNELIRRLFALGFVLGNHQDISRIRSRVPQQYIRDFDENISL